MSLEVLDSSRRLSFISGEGSLISTLWSQLLSYDDHASEKRSGWEWLTGSGWLGVCQSGSLYKKPKKTGALVLLVWLLINLTFDIFLRLIQVNTLVFPGGVPSPWRRSPNQRARSSMGRQHSAGAAGAAGVAGAAGGAEWFHWWLPEVSRVNPITSRVDRSEPENGMTASFEV